MTNFPCGPGDNDEERSWAISGKGDVDAEDVLSSDWLKMPTADRVEASCTCRLWESSFGRVNSRAFDSVPRRTATRRSPLSIWESLWRLLDLRGASGEEAGLFTGVVAIPKKCVFKDESCVPSNLYIYASRHAKLTKSLNA